MGGGGVLADKIRDFEGDQTVYSLQDIEGLWLYSEMGSPWRVLCRELAWSDLCLATSLWLLRMGHRGQRWISETSQEAYCSDPNERWWWLGPGCSTGGNKKWLDSIRILRRKSTGFADWLWGVVTRLFDQSKFHWEGEIFINWDEYHFKEEVIWGKKIRCPDLDIWVWDVYQISQWW